MQPLERDHAGRIFDPYLDIFRHAAAQRGLETCCLQRGIRDLSVPSIPDMKGTLDDIDAAIAAGGCVYVHCWGGRGLTGTVLGCWLARHGERNPLAALSLLTSNARKHFPRVPEMPQQQAFVRLWSIGQ
jgi:protein-tyrosine phosphatase